jgi:CDP-diacylglycerol--glycerol-3-phosphate 3-phosphatidyltransferase
MKQANKAIEYLPNILTLFRILAIPCLVMTFYFNNKIFNRCGAIIFFVSAITDFLDGYIARKFNAQSSFGTIFDPIADKLIAATVLLMLVKHRNVNEIPCLLILLREFVVSGLREFLALVKVKLPVLKIGKVKTVVQMVSLFLLILGSQGSCIIILDKVGEALLWTAAIFTVFTSYFYLKEFLKLMKNTNFDLHQ